MTRARNYVNRIRNCNKQAYAASYLSWIENGRSGNEPDHRGLVTAMAASSVRQNIRLEIAIEAQAVQS